LSLAQSNRRYKRGFTLIEILIVLCVIAILAGLLFPVFARVREGARRTTCLNNLKQIGMYMQMYAADNNGYLPEINPPGVEITCAWADRMYPYVKKAELFECPSYPEGSYRPGCPANEGDITFDGSYDLNALEVDGRVRETRLRSPASTILMLDGRGKFVNPGKKPLTTVQDLTSSIGKLRHDNGANVLFGDWHVKWLRPESMVRRGMWRADDQDNPPPTPTPAAP
jgi:prepilin-type N-terminal cleavage/methylation domain-containing protein/prepilin-type processing-associated H-X9-DG protein